MQPTRKSRKKTPGDIRQAAASRLRRRRYTVSEMRRKLAEDGFGDPEIAELVRGLERSGLLDDADYARAYILDKSRLLRRGPRRIRIELLQKGIDPELAEDALAEHYPREACLENMAALVRKWQDGPRPCSLETLRSRLLGRGYPPGMVAEVLRGEMCGRDAGIVDI